MEKFKPTFGLKNKHIQTLYSSFFRKPIKLEYQKEIFELQDGDIVECFWHNQPDISSSTPIVVLFHGLEGSYNSPYIQGVMNKLSDIGYSSVLMHFRGCGDIENKKARLYHSGDTSDAKEWIEYLSSTYQNSKLFAVGYSLGGNMLLKLLGEMKDKSKLTSAISVSAPIDLANSAIRIQKGFSKIYEKHLLKHLKKALLKKYKLFDMENIINLKKSEVKNIDSIWMFDHLYTAKMHDFETAKNYYKLSSAKQYLKDIKIPTLIIHAIDDPFMTKDIVPNTNEISDMVELEISTHGGHVGFIGGSIFKPRYWLEDKIVNYISKSK
jgi:predicted alpha/beta-fold hydrolase